jgi:RNA polymerase sigma-70 factor (ECF subfamily)
MWIAMPETNSDQLLSLARAGDTHAQQELLMLHRERLKRMISAYLDPRLTARLDPSDVLQEALTCAAVRLPQYLKDQPLQFYPWLRQIVREQLITVHRKHVQADRRSVRKEQALWAEFSEASAIQLASRLVSGESSPSRQASIRELRIRVKQALGELNEPDRELLLMRFVEQLKIREISEVLDISESAVKSRLARALQKLNQMVRHDHE